MKQFCPSSMNIFPVLAYSTFLQVGEEGIIIRCHGSSMLSEEKWKKLLPSEVIWCLQWFFL